MSLPSKHYRSIASDSEISRIRDAAETILCSYGFGVQNRTLLDALAGRGCQVDFSNMRVSVTPELFRTLEDAARRSMRPMEPDPGLLRRAKKPGLVMGRNIVKIHEPGATGRRLAVLEDNRTFAEAAESIPEISTVGPIYSSSDVPGVIEPIVSTAETMKLSNKPFSYVEMFDGSQLPYLEELETIASGRQVRYHASFASITRFTLDARAASCLVAVHEANGLKAWGTNSCPFAGLNAPVTAAGCAAMAMAEMIGGWLPGWALDEDVRLGIIPVSATVDMRTTRSLFSSSNAILIDALLFQIFDRLYGMDSHAETTVTFTDGKVPGYQAMAGKLEKSLSMFALTGCDPAVHFGMLEGGNAISPAQILLDIELNRELERLVGGVRIDTEAIALDDLLTLGPNGSYLATEHTVANFRTEAPSSLLFDGTSFTNPVDEAGKQDEIVSDAEARYLAAANAYPGSQKPTELIRAIDGVVERARRTLVDS